MLEFDSWYISNPGWHVAGKLKAYFCIFVLTFPPFFLISSEMMSHPHLLPEVDVSALGPMLPADTIGSLEESYLGKVQVS